MIQPACVESILPFWQGIVKTAFAERLSKVKCIIIVTRAVFAVCMFCGLPVTEGAKLLHDCYL